MCAEWTIVDRQQPFEYWILLLSLEIIHTPRPSLPAAHPMKLTSHLKTMPMDDGREPEKSRTHHHDHIQAWLTTIPPAFSVWSGQSFWWTWMCAGDVCVFKDVFVDWKPTKFLWIATRSMTDSDCLFKHKKMLVSSKICGQCFLSLSSSLRFILHTLRIQIRILFVQHEESHESIWSWQQCKWIATTVRQGNVWNISCVWLI